MREVWNPRRIDGPRVVLRRHRPEDLPSVRRWYRDPELARLTRYSVRPMSDDEIDRFFHDATALARDGRLRHRRARESGGSSASRRSATSIPTTARVLFHISIGEHDAWGRGYGTEATELMLGLAFERIGLHRVGLSVFSFNERAIRATRRPASAIEGRRARRSIRDGRRWDELQMGILSHEWQAHRAARPATR